MSPIEDRRFSDSKRLDWLEDTRADAARAGRWEYYKPALILLAGYVISVSIVISQAKDVSFLGALLGSIAVVGLFLIIAVPIGLLGLILACKLFGSDAGTLPLALLRLAAVYSITLIISLLLPGCFSILVGGLIMAGMIAILFEMELAEGAVVTIVSWVIFIGAGLALQSIR